MFIYLFVIIIIIIMIIMLLLIVFSQGRMFRRRRSSAREDDCNTETKQACLSKAPMYSQQREVFTRGDHVVDRQKQWASVGAWFLGPKAENGEVFRDLLTKAIDSHIGFRHRYITTTSSI